MYVVKTSKGFVSGFVSKVNRIRKDKAEPMFTNKPNGAKRFSLKLAERIGAWLAYDIRNCTPVNVYHSEDI